MRVAGIKDFSAQQENKETTFFENQFFKTLQMLFLVVALLCKTAFAEKEVYNIPTAKRHGGFYVQIDESGKIFQQLDGAKNPWGYFTYLYSLSEGSWNIGIKNEKGDFTGSYNAATSTTGNDGPPVKGWKNKKGTLQTFRVEKKQSLVSTLEETEANKGSDTKGGGVLCLTKEPRKWIMMQVDDSRMCDDKN